MLATTATANARVTEDVATSTGRLDARAAGPLARSSLQLAVVDRLTPIQRFAWVVDHLPRLAGSGIVYTLTVADAERLAARDPGGPRRAVRVAAYTGGFDPAERIRLEDDLRANVEGADRYVGVRHGLRQARPRLRGARRVTTVAGVVLPAGRPAGRGIDHALVVLLPSDADAGVWDYFATATIPILST